MSQIDPIELLISAFYGADTGRPLEGSLDTRPSKCLPIIRFKPTQAPWTDSERQHVIECPRCRGVLIQQWEFTPVTTLRNILGEVLAMLKIEAEKTADAIVGHGPGPMAEAYRSAQSTRTTYLTARSATVGLEGSLTSKAGGWVLRWKDRDGRYLNQAVEASIITRSGRLVEPRPKWAIRDQWEAEIDEEELPFTDDIIAFVVSCPAADQTHI